MNAKKIAAVTAGCVALLLSACGGGGTGDNVSNPVNGTLTGTAAVGNPVVGGVVKLICAGGSAPAGTTTSSAGAWQATLAGQAMPCAVQVSGGTVNGLANASSYHSIAVALGTVNVTPLTDLLVANLTGNSTPGAWFASLGASPGTLSSVGQTQVDAALGRMRSALIALAPLATVNPVTTSFTPTSGNVSDDMLSALQAAMAATGTAYATLLNSAAAAAFSAPASNLASALTTAYAATVSGAPAPTAPAAPSGAAASAAGSTQISVSWAAVNGATGYNVYRSTSASVQLLAANRLTATPVSASPFADTGLSASTAYYYKVTAVNAAGESASSAEVSASTGAAGGGAGSAIGSGLYSAVRAVDNAGFLTLLETACTSKTAISGATIYSNCTQPAAAPYASNLTANMYLGGLPFQTGGSVESGPSSYSPRTAKVSVVQGMSGVAVNDSCTVRIAEPYIPIVPVETNGVRYYATGVNFSFRGTADDSITVTSTGVVSEYTMTNGQGGKIEVHPNLALFGPGQSGTEAVVGTVVNGMWSSYFMCN